MNRTIIIVANNSEKGGRLYFLYEMLSNVIFSKEISSF